MADLAPITIEGTPAAPGPPPEAAPGPTKVLGADDGKSGVLVNPEGQVVAVPVENLGAAMSQGFRPATDVEEHAARTGVAGDIAAAATGAARGLSFGLSDSLTIGADRLIEGDKGAEEMRHELRMLKEAHPNASLVGEIGGSLAPLALGLGPVGAAAEIGEGGSLLARAGARALAAAPGAAMEGAAIGLGSQLSEDVLGNHDLVAQKYISAAIKGGALGMLLGAGTHAGVGAIADKLGVRAERAAARAETAAAKAEGRAEGLVGGKLADLAEEQAGKALLPQSSLSAAELQKLGRTTEDAMGRFRQIGRTMLDEGIVTAGATKSTIAQRVTRRVGELGEELGALRKSFDKAAVRPSAEVVGERIKREVLEPLISKPFAAKDISAIRPYLEELGTHLEGKTTFESFEELHKLRRGLDNELERMKAFEKLNMGAPAPGHAELKAVRGILEGEYEAAAERAAKELGEDTATKYRFAKSVFADLKTAEGWTKKAAAREAQNHAVSLTDVISFSHGGPAGIAMGVANMVRRKLGNQIAAVVADKAAVLTGVQRAQEAYDARMARAVEGFYKGKRGAASARPKVDPEAARALRTAVKDPEALQQRITERMTSLGMRDSAPKITQGAVSTFMRAGAWLQGRLPPEPRPVAFKFGVSAPRALPPMSQARLEAAVSALDIEPTLHDIEHGRPVDRQRIEALKFINPDAYHDLVSALVRYGQENGATLTRQQEVALSLLTGQPIGVTMQPSVIRGFQKVHEQNGTPSDPTQPSTPNTPIQGGGGAPSPRANALRSGIEKMDGGDS